MSTPEAEKPTASVATTTASCEALGLPPTPTNSDAPVTVSSRIEALPSSTLVAATRENSTLPAATTKPEPRSTPKSAATYRSEAVAGRSTSTLSADQSTLAPTDAVLVSTTRSEM